MIVVVVYDTLSGNDVRFICMFVLNMAVNDDAVLILYNCITFHLFVCHGLMTLHISIDKCVNIPFTIFVYRAYNFIIL